MADKLLAYVDDVEADLVVIRGDVTTAEGDIDTLETWRGVAEGEIGALETSMGVAEGDIDTAEAAIVTLQASSRVLLDEDSGAGAILEVKSADVDDYDTLELEFVDVRPATDSVGLWLRLSEDLGSSWEDGAFHHWKSVYIAGTGGSFEGEVKYGDTDDRFYLVGAAATFRIPNTAGNSVRGFIRVCNFNSSYPRITGELTYSLLGNCVLIKVVGGYAGSLDVDGFKISFESGNVTSGTLRLWGLPRGS